MNQNEQNFMVQKIRTQYTEKAHTELDTLRSLDARVKRPANVFGYGFGSVSALVMGFGMSLAMTDFGAHFGIAEPLVPGIAIGLVGIAMAVVNYPIYKAILKNRRKKYAEQIVKLSDKLMGV